MTYHRFSIGTKVFYNSIQYEVINHSLDNGQRITLQEIDNNVIITRSLDELVIELQKGNLCFQTQTRIKRKNENPTVPNPEELNIDLADYPPHLVDIAQFRLRAITPLLLLGNDRTHKVFIERSNQLYEEAKKARQPMSARSLYRWIADYESGGGEIRCLIPNVKRKGGPGKSRLPIEVLNLVDSVIKSPVSSREESSVHGILAVLAARIEEENRFRPSNEQLPVPALSTVTRRIESLDYKDRLTGKHGKKIGGKMIKQVGKTYYPELPLERVEFDHTKTDLIVIDDKDNLPLGRCTISFALDMATRYPIGYYLGFEPPSYYTVLECLYHSIWPKPDVRKNFGTEHGWISYGIPNTFVIDQGKELIGKDLSDACESLGIVLMQAPVKTPEFKGGIERNFRTLNSGLFHQLPGTTFSNFLERGDYASEKEACVSLYELEKALNIFLLDDYCERFHHGLNGIPARRWENALETNFFPRLPKDSETLRILLGRVDHRVIHRYGIDIDCIRYNCQDLAYLRLKKAGEKVKIKYHPGDLSRIHVYNEYEHKYIEVPAIDQEYTDNLSLWKHKVIKQFGKVTGDKEDLVALGRAKIKIQDIVDAARNRSKVTHRAKIARWDTGGKPKSLAEKEVKPKSLPQPQEITVAKNTRVDVEIASSNDLSEGWEVADGIPASQKTTF